MGRLILADLRSGNCDGKSRGHFFTVGRTYLKIFGNICETKVSGGPIYRTGFDEKDLMLLPCDFIEGESKPLNIIRMIRNGFSLFKNVGKQDVVVIQHSQPALVLLVLLVVYRGNSNLYQIQYSEEPMQRGYFSFFMGILGKKLKGVICPNDVVGQAFKRPFLVIPDYLYCGADKYFHKTSYQEKQFDFCYLGRLNDEKGVLEVLRRFRNTNITFLVAGISESDDLKKELERVCEGCDNISLKLDYLSDDEYNKGFMESRYCIMNYQGEYLTNNRSSGVIFDTLFKGTPVVGRRCPALQFVEDEGCGYLYDDLSNFDPNIVLQEKVHQEYLNAIEAYKEKQKKHIQRLIDFLNINKTN